MSDEETVEQPVASDESADTSGQPDTGGQDLAAELDKWKSMARKHEEQAKRNADKAKRLDELEEQNKSEVEKASSKATEAERRAAEAEAKALRYEVAIEKGVPQRLMRFLNGSTQEELAEQADELLEALGGGDKPQSRRPREKLKSGAASESEPAPDPKKLADSILNSGGF